MFAPSLDHHPVNNMCFYCAKTEIRSDFKCCFFSSSFYSYIKKLPITV